MNLPAPVLEVLQLVKRGMVYHTVREGGNESYRVNRNIIKYLLAMELIYRVKENCCRTTFALTEKGEKLLYGKQKD